MRRAVSWRATAASGLLALAACGPSGGGENAPGADTGEVRFVLTLPEGATDTLFVQRSTESRPAAWLDLLRPDGERTVWWERCELADCGVAGETTAVCGAALPEVLALVPGGTDSVSLRWNRLLSVRTDEGCEGRIPAPEGTWTARFCWADAWTPLPTAPPGLRHGHVGAPECVDRTFTLPGAGEVRGTVRRAAER